MQPRTQISVLVTLVATSVLFCVGAVAVLLAQPPAAPAIVLLPLVMAISLATAVALGRSLAPRLLDRRWERHQAPVYIRRRHGERHRRG